MRRLMIHLLIAVLTFAVGLAASMLWDGFLSPPVQQARQSVASVSRTRVLETRIEPLQNRCGCVLREEKVSPTGYVEAQKALISGGVLNGKAISLPKPAYPAIARSARASGVVTVQVVVDANGCVQSARAIGGHPLLQSAATEAAQQACFTPTLLSGQPVDVSGVISYNFALE